jgi:hypothetical protein
LIGKKREDFMNRNLKTIFASDFSQKKANTLYQYKKLSESQFAFSKNFHLLRNNPLPLKQSRSYLVLLAMRKKHST